ncbi:IL-6 subfamily cytokine M17 [Ictalurus punctatus]|uniref:Ciliary neurotrophic factor n=1 Tax=Ictalurus punctatus TaxID=7998 RepID=A0A2D0RVI8_ICTPU|nr:IL-6 subfamily cytokine M17 [Ictalurus punctatus]
MNGHDRNMFWQGHRQQSTSRIFLSLVLLTVIELVNTTIPCKESCNKTIHKGVKLSKLMKKNTAELIKTYQANEGDFAKQFCKMQNDNVPTSSLSGQTSADHMLNIYTRLKEFQPHIKKVLEQQTDLLPSQSPLLNSLNQTLQRTGHLVHKVTCILQILQPNIPLSEPAARPTGIPLPQNVFQQKVYGCVVLTRLNKFLSRVVDELRSLKGSMCVIREKKELW